MLTSFTLANHLLLLFFIAVVIRGWHIATRPGMVFDFIGKWLLYIPEEETLKAMPETHRTDKLLALMALEAGLMQIDTEHDPHSLPPTECNLAIDEFEQCLAEMKAEHIAQEANAKKNEAKLKLLAEVEAFLVQQNAAFEVNYAQVQVAYEAAAKKQAWKRWAGKPLGNCVECASSVFGISGQLAAYWSFIASGQAPVWFWAVLPVSVAAIAGMQSFFNSNK